MYQEYVDDFENKLVQLSAVNAKLERRIEIGTRNKDAVCYTPKTYRLFLVQGPLNRLTRIYIYLDIRHPDNERQPHIPPTS